MGKNYIFKLDNKSTFRQNMKNYVIEKVSLIGLPYMQEKVEDYINKNIIDEGINRNTELVKWVLSKDGRGFLGWKKGYAEEQIEKMKTEIKRTTIVFTKKMDIKFQTSNSDYLEVVLRAAKDRTSLGKRENYKFLENWYEWITKGYIGNQGFKVFYQQGRGESEVASMIDAKKPERWSIARDNIIVKKKNPALEALENNEKNATIAFRKILEEGIKKSFR